MKETNLHTFIPKVFGYFPPPNKYIAAKVFKSKKAERNVTLSLFNINRTLSNELSKGHFS